MKQKFSIKRYAASAILSLVTILLHAATINITGYSYSGKYNGYFLFNITSSPITVRSSYSDGYFNRVYIDDELVYTSNAGYWWTYSLYIPTRYLDGKPHKIQLKNTATDKGICYISYDTSLCSNGIYYGVFDGEASVIGASSNLKTANILSKYEYNGVKYPVKTITQYAFSGCSSLTEVKIPSSITSTGNYAFDNCTNLKSVVIEDGETKLELGYNYYATSSSETGQGLFHDCPLTDIYVGRNLSHLSSYYYAPFEDKTTLKNVSFGPMVTAVSSYALCGCSSLTEISIPENVVSIGDYAFSNCISLNEMTVHGATPPNVIGRILDGYNTIYGATLYVPEGSVELYKSTEPWSNFENIVGIEVDESAIADIESADVEAPAEFYNLRGARISADALAPGVYIKRQGGQATKVLIQ